ncbi:MAG: hypothetical protein ACOCXG_03440 [Nanoarchaeota archaeon]
MDGYTREHCEEFLRDLRGKSLSFRYEGQSLFITESHGHLGKIAEALFCAYRTIKPEGMRLRDESERNREKDTFYLGDRENVEFQVTRASSERSLIVSSFNPRYNLTLARIKRKLESYSQKPESQRLEALVEVA